QWARLTERRRKEKMKEAIVRKHALRLVEKDEVPIQEDSGPVVREVKGPGRFQIRKVTKADLRKAAEALSQQETPDPFALYAKQDLRPATRDLQPDFEDPLFDDVPTPVSRVKPSMPRPVPRKPKEVRSESARIS